MKRIVVFALLFFLLLSVLAGCANDTAENGGSEAETAASTEAAPAAIDGTWKYTFDYRSVIDATQQDSAETDSRAFFLLNLYDGLSDLVILELREDGTFTMKADEAVRQENRRQLEDRLNSNLPDLIASYLGITPDELATMLADEGLAVDEASMNAWAAQYIEDLDVMGFLDSAPIDEASEGTYVYDDGYLYFIPESGTLFFVPEGASNVPCLVEVDDRELRIVDVTNDIDPGMRGLLPLVFVR